MKKRIRELANCAGEYTDYDTGLLTDEFILKFTELIVRQCAKVAFDDWCEGTNESSSEMAILKYFGVEE